METIRHTNVETLTRQTAVNHQETAIITVAALGSVEVEDFLMEGSLADVWVAVQVMAHVVAVIADD